MQVSASVSARPQPKDTNAEWMLLAVSVPTVMNTVLYLYSRKHWSEGMEWNGMEWKAGPGWLSFAACREYLFASVGA